MSIINEALRKTQQSRKLDNDKRIMAKEKTSEQAPANSRAALLKKLNFLRVSKQGGFLTATLLLSMMAYVGYQHIWNKTLPVVALKKTREQLVFTGTFVSDQAKIAVINKQSYHLGDSVNGMKIIAINQDSVNLQRDDKVIQIRPGATYML